MQEFKVKADSNPKRVAGAIINALHTGPGVALCAMGPAAVNQAVKSVAIARRIGGIKDKEIVCLPEFCDKLIDGENRTTMLLSIKRTPKEA